MHKEEEKEDDVEEEIINEEDYENNLLDLKKELESAFKNTVEGSGKERGLYIICRVFSGYDELED